MRYFLCLNIIFVFNLSHLLSTTYYVSNGGNNSNSGTSLADAFLTIQHATNLLSAGDTVFVSNGTYAGFDIRNVNGTASAPIVFQTLGSNVIINSSGPIRNDGINIENADYIVIDGFTVINMPGNGNGIRVVLSDFCVIRNNDCDNNAERGIFTGFTDDILIEYNICTNSVDEHGIYVSNSSDRPIIRYNECYGNNNIGIHLNGDLSAGGDGIISDPQIYGNILHDNNLAAGINMDGVLNPLIYNNLIYNNHSAQGIALFQQDGAVMTSGAKIYNNTIIVPSDGRWGILLKAGADANTEIYNNIILNFHAWRGCIAAETISQLSCDYNLLHDKMSASGDGSTIPLSSWQALGLDLNSILAGNLADIFSNGPGNDYHLFNGSQAVNTGSSFVSSDVTVDLDFVPRPVGSAYDIGAYEYLGAVAINYKPKLKAKLRNTSVQLSWSDVKPNSMVEYQLERSNNGIKWDLIHSMPSRINKNEYYYSDHNPLNGLNYYRLKIMDRSSNFEYSDMISVSVYSKNNLTIYPNPAREFIHVESDLALEKIRIYNMQGQVVLDQQMQGSASINLSHLLPGLYYISGLLGENIFYKLLIIN